MNEMTTEIIEDMQALADITRERVGEDELLSAVQLYSVVLFNDGSSLVLAPTEEQADYLQQTIEVLSEMNMSGRELH